MELFKKKDYPLIMGVLNVTPDSFSDGGNYSDKSKAVNHALQMIKDGADIIDVGGESTRPGAEEIDENTEISRVIPVITEIKKLKKKILISIDTTKFEVAKQAIEAGADIINDISGLSYDVRLADLAAQNDIPIIIMHIKGTPKDMQIDPVYTDPVIEIFDDLKNKIKIARSRGAKKIIADVGIGFGKTYAHNLALLKEHNRFKDLGVPILLGISRKSFIGKMLNIKNPVDRDIPTAIIHSMLLSKNTDIIRVHNVKLMSMVKNIFNKIK